MPPGWPLSGIVIGTVSTVGSSPEAAAQSVRESVAEADRRRRMRDASLRIWRAAPIGAGVAAVVAVFSYLVRWPSMLALGLLAGLFAGLVVVALVGRRRRPLTDAAAAALDAGAGLRGELRSASWFAAGDRRDPWAEYHLRQAADRLADMEWTRLYPAPRPRTAQLATAVLATITVAIALAVPERAETARPTGQESAPAASGGAAALADGLLLSPELVKRLQDLLAAAERGDARAAGTLANDEALREMLDRLAKMNDPALLQQLADAVAEQAGKPPARNAMQELADRARQAADSGGLSSAMQDALEQLADELEVARPELARSGESGDTSEGGPGSQGQSATGGRDGSMPEGEMQLARDADAAGGAGVLMMADEQGGPGGGMPGGGTGGAGGADPAAQALSAIEAALKQELVQASQDRAGEHVDSEIRRRTEAGEAAVGFTGGAATAFDRARATAPPPVPEARRSGVHLYFVRESQ